MNTLDRLHAGKGREKRGRKRPNLVAGLFHSGAVGEKRRTASSKGREGRGGWEEGGKWWLSPGQIFFTINGGKMWRDAAIAHPSRLHQRGGREGGGGKGRKSAPSLACARISAVQRKQEMKGEDFEAIGLEEERRKERGILLRAARLRAKHAGTWGRRRGKEGKKKKARSCSACLYLLIASCSLAQWRGGVRKGKREGERPVTLNFLLFNRRLSAWGLLKERGEGRRGGKRRAFVFPISLIILFAPLPHERP